jgi:AAA domain
LTACGTCGAEVVEIGPAGCRCPSNHWTARADFSPNGHHPEAGAPTGVNLPTIISASDLVAKVFPEPRWAVDGVVPEGLNLLAGPPKMGKSFLLLGLGVAIAAGGYALGKVPVAAGDVLYLALEDTQRRLQERLVRILDGAPAPDRLHLVTAWPRLDDGGVAAIDTWLGAYPAVRLVAIDTLAMIRSRRPPGGSL